MRGDQNSDPEALLRSRRGSERKEQGRYLERSDCGINDVEELGCRDHGGEGG